MKRKEINTKIFEDEWVVDEDWSNAAYAKLPYSTKQFKNIVYLDKGKIHSHHLPYFHMDDGKDDWESLLSSFDEKDFLYLSHKEVKRINVGSIGFINSNTTKCQRVNRKHQATLKSFSDIKNKSSWEILKDMLI